MPETEGEGPTLAPDARVPRDSTAPGTARGPEDGQAQAPPPEGEEDEDEDEVDESEFNRYEYWLESFAKRKEKKDFRKFPKLARESLRLVWSVGRWEFVVSAFLQTLGGAGAFVQLIVGKDVLAGVLSEAQVGAAFTEILPHLGLLVGVTALMRITNAILMERQRLLSELCSRRAVDQVLDVAVSVDLEAFETATFYDRMQRANIDGQSRPYQMVQGLLSIVGGLVGSVGIGFALRDFEPLLLPFLVVAYVPLWIARRSITRENYEFLVEHVQNQRERSYLRNVLIGRDEAKEVRAFGLGRLLRNRHDGLYEHYLLDLRKRLRSRMVKSMVGGLSSSFLFAVTAGVVVYLWKTGKMDLADAGMALAGVQMLGGRLESLIGGVSGLYENSLFLADFHSFLELKPAEEQRRATGHAPPGFERLEVDGVVFHYPGSKRPALKGVSMEIGRGEVIALVGENGSGKTTLAKLLAHLYTPTSGRILWDGVDTSTMDPDGVRSHIAAIFQDFVRYKLPARENIGAGRHERFDDFQSIVDSAAMVGADEFINKLPAAYDTVLSKEFKGGKDLSIGQWQRVALARAFFRDAPFIILDEPTAALDARAEHALFESIRTMTSGRSVLLISHRFSSVRSADRIYVLHQGEVIESGTHEELMREAGLYADLFTLQASAYLETPDDASLLEENK